MNRALQYFNLFGVIVLAALCVFQWRMNRQLNLDVNGLEKTRIEQAARIEEQSKKLKGTTEDLETFREQLTRAHVDLKQQTEKSATDETKIEALKLERDALKESLAKWTNAVIERDKRLNESNAQIQKLADDLNAAVEKYNRLATNYNAVVKDLNELRSASKEPKP
jgi:chromosome segregation ATPase